MNGEGGVHDEVGTYGEPGMHDEPGRQAEPVVQLQPARHQLVNLFAYQPSSEIPS